MAKKNKAKKPLLFIEILCIALIIFFLALIVKIIHRNNQITQTYSGILPCADCSGIDTTLTITSQKLHDSKGIYIMQQAYEGKSVPPYITSGNWITTTDNSPARQTILELNPDKPNAVAYYLLVDSSTLETLDQEKHTILSPFPMTLHILR